ncbi:MAG: RNase adapter RapZ [Methylophilaceae bacterium]
MNLYIITGLSGAGKTNALRTFEDNNYYCIDNLPAKLLLNAIQDLKNNHISSVAISIDSRSLNIEMLPEILEELKLLKISFKLIFLTASIEQIIKRFNESRRKHPLSKNKTSLREAIVKDQEILSMIEDDYIHIDTSNLNLTSLNVKINDLIDSKLSFHIHLSSFAYKKAIPLDIDFIFDVRELPNPFYKDDLKNLTGLDKPLKKYLLEFEETKEIIQDISSFLGPRIKKYALQGRKYLAIGFGCTGGRHRSVFITEEIANIIKNNNNDLHVSTFHRELNV